MLNMDQVDMCFETYLGYTNKPSLDVLMHYGMPKRSGRYPYGSGENPYQHSGDFLSRIDELKKKGWSEKEIADDFGLTTDRKSVV